MTTEPTSKATKNADPEVKPKATGWGLVYLSLCTLFFPDLVMSGCLGPTQGSGELCVGEHAP